MTENITFSQTTYAVGKNWIKSEQSDNERLRLIDRKIRGVIEN